MFFVQIRNLDLASDRGKETNPVVRCSNSNSFSKFCFTSEIRNRRNIVAKSRKFMQKSNKYRKQSCCVKWKVKLYVGKHRTEKPLVFFFLSTKPFLGWPPSALRILRIVMSLGTRGQTIARLGELRIDIPGPVTQNSLLIVTIRFRFTLRYHSIYYQTWLHDDSIPRLGRWRSRYRPYSTYENLRNLKRICVDLSSRNANQNIVIYCSTMLSSKKLPNIFLPRELFYFGKCFTG